MTYPRMLDKVLHTESSNLVACWAHCGESGAVLYDFARFGPYNGTIDGGVTPGTTERGYDFDGVDGSIDIYPAAVAPVHGFDGHEGSVVVLHQIPAAAYTDGIKRMAFQMQVDNDNLIQLRKAAANNTFEMEWLGDGDSVIVTQDPFSDTDVMRHGLGWSVTDDMVTGYYNGTSLGNSNMVFDFVGAISAIMACIGASTNAGDNPYHGWIGLVALWNKKLTDTQFGYLGLP